MATEKSAKADTSNEPEAVIEAKPGEVTAAVEKLGAAVAANQQSEQGTADAEGQHSGALQAIDNIIDQIDLDPEALVFDVRDEMLEIIKHRPKPWSATSQAEQRDVAGRVEEFGRKLIRQIVEAVAARGQDPIRVLLTKVNAGGDDIVITGKVKMLDAEQTERDNAILALHHAIGKHVVLTRASVDDYAGDGRDPEVDEDEPPLDFAAGGGEADDDIDPE
jgi:hypothetical protein